MSGGKKTTTTSNQQQSSTTQLPAWMTSAGEDLFKQASASSAANPVTAYTGQMTAGAAPNQTAASAAARANAGNGQADLSAARDMTSAAAMGGMQTVKAQAPGAAQMTAAQQGGTGNVVADMIRAREFTAADADRYMNPYLDKVQGNTLRTMRDQRAMDMASTSDAAAAASAFGGTRHALLEAETAKNSEQIRSDYVDSSNAAGYANAQGQFNADANRVLAADQANQGATLAARTTNATLLDQMMGRNTAAENDARQFNATSQNGMATANADRTLTADRTNVDSYSTMLDRMMAGGAQMGQIGESANTLGQRDIAALAETGATDQATDQAAKSAAYQEFLRMQQAPNEQYQNLMAILAGTPRNVTTTGTSSGSQTQKQSGSFLDTMMGLGQLGVSAYSSGMFSDRRLKRDIERIDELPNGLGVYRYGYVWDAADEPARIGVMADEVERLMPEALGPIVAGFATVNYDMIGGLIA